MIVTVIATGYELKAKGSTIENLALEIFNKTSEAQMQITDEGLIKKNEEDEPQGVKEGQKRNLPSWLVKKSKF